MDNQDTKTSPIVLVPALPDIHLTLEEIDEVFSMK